MAVKIRLKRVGAKNHPVFRLVAADSRSPRDGKFIEELGTYHPTRVSNKVSMNLERIEYWLRCGAVPSDTVRSFLRAAKREAAAAAKEEGEAASVSAV